MPFFTSLGALNRGLTKRQKNWLDTSRENNVVLDLVNSANKYPKIVIKKKNVRAILNSVNSVNSAYQGAPYQILRFASISRSTDRSLTH